MAVNWEDFLREVLPEVAGCPVQIAENAIRNAAIEFCNQSRVWRERIVDVPLVADTATYTLDTTGASAAANILGVHRVRLTDSEIPLPTISKQQLDDQWLQTTTDRPHYYNNDEPKIIRFYPTPNASYTAEVFATLKPTLDGVSGPNFLFDDWLEPISHGAKARLKAMSGRPWQDTKMIQFHRREFITGWTEARIRDSKSNVQSSTFMQPKVRFGRYTNSRWYK
jgi:hypothetical protein